MHFENFENYIKHQKLERKKTLANKVINMMNDSIGFNPLKLDPETMKLISKKLKLGGIVS